MTFWLIATAMVCLTSAIVLVPLFWSRATTGGSRPRVWPALGLAALIPVAALAIYVAVGSPQLVGSSAPAVNADPVAAAHANGAIAGGAMPEDAAGGDLAAAVQRLRDKLARNPQDPDGWRLLAQSYDFAGRPAEAAAARARAEQAASGARVEPMPEIAPDAGNAVVATGADVTANAALVAQAEALRRKRDFPNALKAFAELARQPGMTADLWADFADATGAARGKLDADSAAYIQKALQLDPRHPKALWLLGSYQTDQGDYAGALRTWQALAAVLPADSSDARIIAANIGEARQKLGTKAGDPSTSMPAAELTALMRAGANLPNAGTVVRGEIDLDKRWHSKVPAGTTLFIFAKEAGAAGPPLAVIRNATGAWPVKFQLDDSNAMMPTRKLSGFTRVIVEARISRSGNATPQAGDLRAVSAVLDPHRAGNLRLVINEAIG